MMSARFHLYGISCSPTDDCLSWRRSEEVLLMSEAPYRWSEIVNHLVAQIRAGEYPVGSLLPSVRMIKEQWSCSDSTAQRALRELVDHGWARAEPRRGFVVISPSPGSSPGPTRPDASTRVDPTLAGQAPAQRADLGLTGLFDAPSSATTAAQGPTGPVSSPTTPERGLGSLGTGYLASRPPLLVQVGSDGPPTREASVTALEVHLEAAPPDVALALRLPEHAPVIVRRRIFSDQITGIPIELRVSYLREADARGTALAVAEMITETWLSAVTRYGGRTPTQVTTSIKARRAEDIESYALGLHAGSMVLVRSAVASDAAGAIDLTRCVWSAETTTLTDQRPTTT